MGAKWAPLMMQWTQNNHNSATVAFNKINDFRVALNGDILKDVNTLPLFFLFLLACDLGPFGKG